MNAIDTPLDKAQITGLTPAVAAKMARGLGLETVRDLLEHAPRAYLDLSKSKQIGELKIGEEATVTGAVAKVDARPIRGRRHMLTVRVGDGTGYIDIVFWNQPYRARNMPVGTKLAVAGRVERRMGKLQMGGSVFVETLGADGGGVHTGRIIPLHRATEGVSANQIRRFVHSALQKFGGDIEEPLPEGVRERHKFPPRGQALRALHFPDSYQQKEKARRRLAFEELFVLQVGLAARKRRFEREAVGIAHAGDDAIVKEFLASLPFTATAAQLRTISEISEDLEAARPMHRLLQGEVGSGKTVVAVAAALKAAAAGSQTAFMAPTEVLAEQHFLTVQRLLEPLAGHAPVDPGRLFGERWGVELLTSSITGAPRKQALDAAANGSATILIGTHALIQEGVSFQRLGLAIIDEQHRFGVHQRVALRAKTTDEAQPDLLIMTATPIPRTLALTLYGDLDVSVLDEMPPGRTPVRTVLAKDTATRIWSAELIKDEVAQGRQAFVVCPLVEESESLEAKAAETEYQRISHDVFPNLRVGLIHGRMKPAVKEDTMRRMRAGEIDVLVATTVIEVGVDFPNATVMLVEDADRFGLSQLHQLRGRIGRGAGASTCVLVTNADLEAPERETARKRLEAMVGTTDGFRLAELDLEIRGEGQIFGRGSVGEETGEGAPAQAGHTDLRFASLVRDVEALGQARKEAFAFVDQDPKLRAASTLRSELRRRFGDRLDWLFVG
ncbi:MAG: ATP-dependent DNA helicase RecG [Actinomycetota bacterium]|nr:ATP-dependent DNA helicase RecG [Actinomycetota bacterium]